MPLDDEAPSWSAIESSARRTLNSFENHHPHHPNSTHTTTYHTTSASSVRAGGGGSSSSERFALQIARHHHNVTSNGSGETDQDQQLRRALHEQNFTLNKLNLAELELYGRDKEVRLLTEALESVLDPTSGRGPGLIFLTGRTGTGKSRLAHELQSLVHHRQGVFLMGIFDALRRDEPFAAIVDALSGLTSQLAASGSSTQNALNQKLPELLEDDGRRVLTDLVPALAEVLGMHQEQGPPKSSTDTVVEDAAFTTRSNRLQYLFRHFFKALSSPEHPVVLVLEHVQWIDAASLALVASLTTDSSVSGLLIATTGRSEDMDDTHPFAVQLAKLQSNIGQSQARVQTIVTGNLDQSAVLSIVSTALRSSEEKTFKLSEIVHQKSNGNALYVIQFLRALYDEGLLRFNLGAMQWMWEEPKVRARFVMDNVVDLTTAKMGRLSKEHQNVLQIASCLGRTFDKAHLEYVVHDPAVRDALLGCSDSGDASSSCWPSDLSACLKKLAIEAVIDYIPQLQCYCFVHDAIHDAAFQLIPPESSVRLQSAVGKRLLRCRKEACRAPKLCEHYYFRAVDLSNVGCHLLDRTAQLELAKHNLEAGNRAMDQAAFATALKYMEHGQQCLGPWSTDPSLALSLASGAVEASYCCGDFDCMEIHMASVLQRDDVPVQDKVRAYLVRILSYGAQDRNVLALETGRRVLMEMGITRLPKRTKAHHVLVEIIKTKLVLRRHTEQSLIALPKLENKRWLQAMSIVDMMISIAYISDINFFAVMNLRMLRWALIHGVCRYTPTAFSMYAIVLCTLGELSKGRMYGNVALTLSERLNARASLAKTITGVYGFSTHWTTSLRICLKPLLYGHTLGMETGEVQIAMYNLYHHGEALLATSATPLKILVPKMQSNSNLMKEYNQDGVRNFCDLALQFALKLLGPSQNPHRLSGDVVKEEEARANAKAVGSELLARVMANFALQLAYYFGDLELADKYSRETRDFAKVAGGHFSVSRNVFFRGLTSLALAQKGVNRRANVRRGSQMLQQLQNWSNAGNVNCIHMAQLLEAEAASLKKRESEAMYLYWKAINTASRNGYLNDKALAHERAFLFHLQADADDLFWAQSHYNDAVQAYCDWDAYQKARHLVHRYGSRFDPATNSSFIIPQPDEVSDYIEGSF